MEIRVQFLALIIMLILVIALVIFAGILRDTAHQLQDRVRTDTIASTRLEATIDRMEAATKRVAKDLAETSSAISEAAQQRHVQSEILTRMEIADGVVADNLADSVSRADATIGPEGAAADAALRTGDSASAIRDRQDENNGN